MSLAGKPLNEECLEILEAILEDYRELHATDDPETAYDVIQVRTDRNMWIIFQIEDQARKRFRNLDGLRKFLHLYTEAIFHQAQQRLDTSGNG